MNVAHRECISTSEFFAQCSDNVTMSINDAVVNLACTRIQRFFLKVINLSSSKNDFYKLVPYYYVLQEAKVAALVDSLPKSLTTQYIELVVAGITKRMTSFYFQHPKNNRLQKNDLVDINPPEYELFWYIQLLGIVRNYRINNKLSSKRVFVVGSWICWYENTNGKKVLQRHILVAIWSTRCDAPITVLLTYNPADNRITKHDKKNDESNQRFYF